MNLPPFLARTAVLAIGLLARMAPGAEPPAVLQRPLEAWLKGRPGGVAAAWVDAGGTAFANAGVFGQEDARPVTADTQFEIGSITKVFTALLLADAVAADRVKLDDRVGPPFAPGAVTYLQLATHTSGLPRLPAGFTSKDPLNPYADQDLAGLVRAFDAAATGLGPAPAAYSSFGFAALGQSLARAWDEPYPALLVRRIIQPLGLKDTVVSWRDADPKRLAPGHRGAAAAKNWDHTAFAPAGAMVSTARDLARVLQACLGLLPEKLLADILAEAARPRVPGDVPNRQIGLAWQIDRIGNDTIVWHNGGTGGYRAWVGYIAAKKTGVVVLTNHSDEVDRLGLGLILGREFTPAVPAPPDKSVAEFPGEYAIRPSFVMTVTAEGTQLFLQATGQEPLTLRRVAADRYSVQEVNAEISFERNAAGKIAALVLHQNGLDQRAPRRGSGPDVKSTP